MKHLLTAILALSIYDVPGKANTFRVEALTETGKYEMIVKAKSVEEKEEEIYQWLKNLE